MVCGVSGDLTDAKGAETVQSLTGRDEVTARVGREPGVSDWQLVSRQNLDAFARVTDQQQFGHLDAECCRSTTA
jgi:acyl dehydratase